MLYKWAVIHHHAPFTSISTIKLIRRQVMAPVTTTIITTSLLSIYRTGKSIYSRLSHYRPENLWKSKPELLVSMNDNIKYIFQYPLNHFPINETLICNYLQFSCLFILKELVLRHTPSIIYTCLSRFRKKVKKSYFYYLFFSGVCELDVLVQIYDSK